MGAPRSGTLTLEAFRAFLWSHIQDRTSRPPLPAFPASLHEVMGTRSLVLMALSPPGLLSAAPPCFEQGPSELRQHTFRSMRQGSMENSLFERVKLTARKSTVTLIYLQSLPLVPQASRETRLPGYKAH